jgi:hypothetical protein
MNLDFKGERWQKAGAALEVIGMAVLLSLAQITLFHIFFSDFLAKHYIVFYNEYIKKVDIFYKLFILLLAKIFGNSYTVSLYNFVAKFFIPVFLVNLGYFTLRRIRRK